jgi:AcrR family transcriptional regulator
MERTSRRQVPDDERSESVAGTAPAGQETLLQAALDAFVEHGFHGTSMRDIAARAGLSVSASYYYFPSKQHLLMRIMTRVTEDLIALLEQARDAAGKDPVERLAAIVRAHVLLHTERQAEAFIGSSELRSLTPANRAAAVALRDKVTAIFKDVIGDGLRRGAFHCAHRAEATLAITTMCTAVAGWYRASGPQNPQAIAERYATLSLRLLAFEARGR